MSGTNHGLHGCSKIHIGSVLCFEFGSRFRVQRVFMKRATKHNQLQCNTATILDSLIAHFLQKKFYFRMDPIGKGKTPLQYWTGKY